MTTQITKGTLVRPNHVGEDSRRRTLDYRVFTGRATSDPYTIGIYTYVDVCWFREARNVLPRQYMIRDLDAI